MYDIRSNAFTQLQPARRPPMGSCTVVEYLQGHDAVLAILVQPERNYEQWLYSLKHNTWAQLPIQGHEPVFADPYGQMAYVANYGVLVNVPKTTLILRPDLGNVKL